jgi:hypothetical protein
LIQNAQALETSYRKGRFNASVKDFVSKGSVKNQIHGLVAELPKPEVKEKKDKNTAYQ